MPEKPGKIFSAIKITGSVTTDILPACLTHNSGSSFRHANKNSRRDGSRSETAIGDRRIRSDQKGASRDRQECAVAQLSGTRATNSCWLSWAPRVLWELVQVREAAGPGR